MYNFCVNAMEFVGKICLEAVPDINNILDRYVGRDKDSLSLIHAPLLYEWLETVYSL